MLLKNIPLNLRKRLVHLRTRGNNQYFESQTVKFCQLFGECKFLLPLVC